MALANFTYASKCRSFAGIKALFALLLAQCATLTGIETLTNKTLSAFKFTRLVSAKTTAYPVTAADSGTTFTNQGAGAMVAFTLPAAVAGLTYRFFVSAAQELRIDPNGTETIGLPSTGVQQGAGKYLTNSTVGGSVIIECVETGKWSIASAVATWTVEA